jgi:hypothetical protein
VHFVALYCIDKFKLCLVSIKLAILEILIKRFVDLTYCEICFHELGSCVFVLFCVGV